MHLSIPNNRWRALTLPAIALVFALSVSAALASMPGSNTPKDAGPRLSDVVPQQVQNGSAALAGKHSGTDNIQVLFYLPFKDWEGLKAFINDVSDPHSPNYGHYLTLDEENARYNPDVAHEQSVISWLNGQGVSSTETVPNHLYVNVHTSTSNIEKLLNVQINDYKLGNRTFFAPDKTPTLPAQVANDIVWIAGLSNYDQYHKLDNGMPNTTPPYFPQDMANAYNVNPLWNSGFTGNGATIGVTLWTVAPDDSTLMQWASDTGANPVTRANGRLVIIPVDGGGTDQDDGEAALDIEATGGIAYQSQIRYYSGAQPTNASMANALNAAGTDPVFNRFISNSWGAAESTNGHNAIDPVLAANTATGHDYLFSSGDNGSWAAGHDPYPDFPTSSEFATSIGGTRFNGDINPNYPGEQTWLYNPTGNNGNPEGSGGGFSLSTDRPPWQVAPGFPVGETKRGYPDVAAEADPETGYYICSTYNGCIQIGGTSLASPLWAGFLTLADQYAVAQGHPHLGFVNPAIYTLAQAPPALPPYHDITAGTNGAYNAGPGWDAVTGVGSTDLWNLARDLAPPVGPTPTPAPCQGFTDVPPGSTFYPYVTCLSGRGIIGGYNDCTFRPGNNVTRGQLSKIIANSAGFNEAVSGQTFEDVPPNSTFYPYVERMARRGIIGGYNCGGPQEPCIPPTNRPYFRPNANATRGQIAKIDVLAAQQALGWPLLNPSTATFVDVPVGSSFYQYVETAVAHGVLGGYNCGQPPAGPCVPPDNKPYFLPGNNATRGQTSKIVANTFFPNCQSPITPTRTPTHAAPTATHTRVPTSTPVHTSTPTVTGTVPTATSTTTGATATPTCQPTDVIQNGGFETGSFSPGWTILDTNDTPVVTIDQQHSGSYSALMGNVSGPEPLGDSSIYQQVTVPVGGGTLSYWYWPYSQDVITFDWQDAYVTDTSGNILAVIMHICDNTLQWTNVTYDMSAFAGQTVRIEFLVHQDGFNDDTGMYVDDVSLTANCP